MKTENKLQAKFLYTLGNEDILTLSTPKYTKIQEFFDYLTALKKIASSVIKEEVYGVEIYIKEINNGLCIFEYCNVDYQHPKIRDNFAENLKKTARYYGFET